MYITRKKSTMSTNFTRKFCDERQLMRKAQLVAATLSITAKATVTDLMQVAVSANRPTNTDYDYTGLAFNYFNSVIIEDDKGQYTLDNNMNDGM